MSDNDTSSEDSNFLGATNSSRFKTLNRYIWDGKIINTLILDDIHYQLNDKNADIINVIEYIHEKSIQINMDKSTILNNYFDYIIRNKRECVSVAFLNIISNILHNSDAKSNIIVSYFCHQLRKLYIQLD